MPNSPWTTLEPLVPTHTYACLQDVEKRCPVYRCGPTFFVSYLRTDHETASGVALNCMSRDAPRSPIGKLGEYLQAHEVTVRIPPFKECTDEKRNEFLQWLKTITHLRSVYIFSELSPSQLALSSNNLVSRTLRYMGRSKTAPKRIVVLEPSVISIVQQPIPRFLTEVPGGLKAVTLNKGGRGGIYVMNLTSLTEETADFLAQHRQWLEFGAIINLAPQDLQCKLPRDRHLVRPGPAFLPLRSKQAAMKFYSEAFQRLWLAATSGLNVLILDTGRRYHAGIVCAMALTLAGGMDGQEAARIVQSRLQTLEFDGYTLAALAHVADQSSHADQKIHRAYDCLATRYAQPTPEIRDKAVDTGSPPLSPALPSDLMKGLGRPAISDHWGDVESAALELPRDHFLRAVRLIQAIFNNVLQDPSNDKYRQIKQTNPKFEQWLKCKFGTLLMETGGWELRDEVWILPAETRLQQLRDVLVYLSNTL